MFKKLFFFVCIIAVSIQAQQIQTSLITAGHTYGAAIKLAKGEIPTAVYFDSLSSNTTLSFYVLVGDTAGKDTTDFLPLTKVDSTVQYSILVIDSAYQVLNYDVFYALAPDPYAYMSNYSGVIYLLPKIAAAQTYNVTAHIRTSVWTKAR